MARDGWTCQYCGSDVVADMTVDHIIPISRNGTDSDENLICACKSCNYSKGAKLGGFFGTARKPLTLPFLISPQNESTSHD